uniref:Uncharacterized protein n=1 Tax=Triticum urartu TaxID=4572 RepID=A0A8R7UDY8_TRIUA
MASVALKLSRSPFAGAAANSGRFARSLRGRDRTGDTTLTARSGPLLRSQTPPPSPPAPRTSSSGAASLRSPPARTPICLWAPHKMTSTTSSALTRTPFPTSTRRTSSRTKPCGLCTSGGAASMEWRATTTR